LSIPDLTLEYRLREAGVSSVAGVDEAGRGALAGPVVAAAVVLPVHRFDLGSSLNGVRDSKQMTSAEREFWYQRIIHVASSIGLGHASAEEIDKLGILPCTKLAMKRAIEVLPHPPAHILLDHVSLENVDLPQTSITRGDSLVLSIAAASVIAKVTRDRTMLELHALYPSYHMARHKGYATATHLAIVREIGPSPIHRKTYAPVAASQT
jgi:ribonuclease HII